MTDPSIAVTEIRDPWTVIPAAEFKKRQERARAAAEAAGLDAVLVYSRGGAFMDMSADVLWLSGHYSQQPYMGDEAGVGTARSHGVVIVPVNGPVTVVVDVPWWRRDLVVADAIRPGIDVTGATAAVLREQGLASQGKRLGVAGSSYMTAAAYLGLQGAVPDATLVNADTLVDQLRVIKSPAEQEVIRQACVAGNATLEALIDAVVEGATEAEAVGEASRVLLRHGGVLYDAACGSGPHAHAYTWGRLPSADPVRRLQKGDMFHVDCYGSVGGYFFDFARSRVVGDDPTPQQHQLLEAPIGVVEQVCAYIKPGMTAGQVFAHAEGLMAQDEFISSIPVDPPEMPGFPAVGHGLGMMWESPWLVENDPMVLTENMYLAVEVLLGHRSIGGAMFEHNGLLGPDGLEVLTTARSRWW